MAGDHVAPDQRRGDYICGEPKVSDGEPCGFPVKTPDGRCPNHPKDGSGTTSGAPKGRKGHPLTANQTSGTIRENLPDHAKPNLRHGLVSVQNDPDGLLDWLRHERPDAWDWVRSKWASYLDDAPFDGDSAKGELLLQAVVMEYIVRLNRGLQLQEGLTHVIEGYTDDGMPYDILEEHPRNLPVNRITREMRNTYLKLGILDDPESQKADAMGGWGEAARRVAMRVDSTASDGGSDDGGE